MLHALLTDVVDVAQKMRDVKIGEASLYALLGFLVVFVGIAFLSCVIWLVGKIMTKVNAPQAVKKTESDVENVSKDVSSMDSEDITEETVAVITAALMAYYQTSNPKCEFTVKRIKRI